MCRAMPFSARAVLALWIKNIFFDVDIVAENKSKCGLSWSVLLRVITFPNIFSYCFCMLQLSSDVVKVFERKVWRVQVDHLHHAAHALSSPNCQQILTKISVVIFDIVVKKKPNRMSFSMALVKFHRYEIDMFLCRNCRASSRIWKVLPNMVFPPIWGEKWRRSEHAHASYPGLFFRPPGFSPYMGREERRVQGLD